MKFWPRDAFEIETAQSPEQVIERLQSKVIKEPTLFCSLSRTAEFYGEVTQNSFRISRRLHYANSFAPLIKGNVQAAGDGARIEISMGLHPIVKVILCLYFFIIGTFISIDFLLVLSGNTPIFMLLFGLVLTLGCFWFEAKKQKAFLRSFWETGGSSAQGKPAQIKK